MVIELVNGVYYKNGEPGASALVGYEDSSNRVVRYTIKAPPEGARSVKLTFHTAGGSGDYDTPDVPVRFFIGTDPDSHANAGADAEYLGQLTLGEDWMTLTGSAEIILLPNQTYYVWAFPGLNTWGWYSWDYVDVHTMETSGTAFLIPVNYRGSWWHTLIHCIWQGKMWMCAMCVVKNGKWHLAGSVKPEGSSE